VIIASSSVKYDVLKLRSPTGERTLASIDLACVPVHWQVNVSSTISGNSRMVSDLTLSWPTAWPGRSQAIRESSQRPPRGRSCLPKQDALLRKYAGPLFMKTSRSGPGDTIRKCPPWSEDTICNYRPRIVDVAENTEECLTIDAHF